MHAELKRLFECDQSERVNHPAYGTAAYHELRVRDQQRRAAARRILSTIPDPAREDLYHAAMLYHHSDDLEDIWQAHLYAVDSVKLGYRPARWLAAASYDRWLMIQGRPQKFGTQFVPDGKRIRLWDVEPETTDAERKLWDVPCLQDQIRRAEELTRIEPIPPMCDAPEWLLEALNRWDQRL